MPRKSSYRKINKNKHNQRKHSQRKHNQRKHSQRKHSQRKHSQKTKNNNKMQNNRLNNNHKKTLKKQKGGSANCNMATVQESSFNIPAIGDIAGLNISSSRAVIYQPNCKTDTYQAMTP